MKEVLPEEQFKKPNCKALPTIKVNAWSLPKNPNAEIGDAAVGEELITAVRLLFTQHFTNTCYMRLPFERTCMDHHGLVSEGWRLTPSSELDEPGSML